MAASTAKKAPAKKATAAKTEASAEVNEAPESNVPEQAPDSSVPPVDPDTVDEDHPNGTTAGVEPGVDRTVPLAATVDYDEKTPGELADEERLRSAAISEDQGAAVLGDLDTLEDGLFEDVDDDSEYLVLSKDVVEEFYYPDTKRPSYRILFTKGQVVRRAQIKELNDRVKAAQDAAEAEGNEDE